MAKKTARVYTLDELKEKSQKALGDPKLVEIVKSAPLNKDGGVNLSWAYDEAEKYVHEQTKDLQKTKEMAVAARFLAMLRRNHKEEFEKLINENLQKPEIKTAVEKKSFEDEEFELHNISEFITRLYQGVHGSYSQVSIKWWSMTEAINFCNKVINAILNDGDLTPDQKENVEKWLIQLLEEKFGLKVKICGHCEYYYHRRDVLGSCNLGRLVPLWSGAFGFCEKWTLKVKEEVSEKKEN